MVWLKSKIPLHSNLDLMNGWQISACLPCDRHQEHTAESNYFLSDLIYVIAPEVKAKEYILYLDQEQSCLHEELKNKVAYQNQSLEFYNTLKTNTDTEYDLGEALQLNLILQTPLEEICYSFPMFSLSKSKRKP